MIHGKTRGLRQNIKRGVREADEHGLPEPTTARPWWIPRAMVEAAAVVAGFSPVA